MQALCHAGAKGLTTREINEKVAERKYAAWEVNPNRTSNVHSVSEAGRGRPFWRLLKVLVELSISNGCVKTLKVPALTMRHVYLVALVLDTSGMLQQLVGTYFMQVVNNAKAR